MHDGLERLGIFWNVRMGCDEGGSEEIKSEGLGEKSGTINLREYKNEIWNRREEDECSMPWNVTKGLCDPR